jgi:hypothetical protein
MAMKKRDFFKVATAAVFAFIQGRVAFAEETAKPAKRDEGLEKKIEQLTLKMERMEAINALQNLISKMDYMFEGGLYEERMKFIAKKTPGVAIEIGARGVFEGYESARRTLVDTEKYYERSHAAGMKKAFPNVKFPSDFAGKFESNLIGSPAIEVAGDGKTAKGVWVSLQSIGKTHDNQDKPQAMWIWWKIGADFVKEDGEWKVWHYMKNPVYATSYDKSWMDNAIAKATGSGFGPGAGPVPGAGANPGAAVPAAGAALVTGTASGAGGPSGAGNAAPPSARGTVLDSNGKITPSHGTTADRPTSKLYHSYDITSEAQLVPMPPEPYETFNDKDAYVYPSLPQS